MSSTDRNYAQLNPFRYRGYYYDVETGYYYLQTRYYNPEWGRFLNADGYLNANGDILGYNMFAYCGNNPVMGYDPEGTFNLDKFFNGGMLLAIGALTVAAAISVASCGAATPLVIAVAAVAFAAGAATAVNGASDIIESVTDYNPVRDTIFAGDEEQYLQYEMQMALGSQLGASAMYGLTDGGNNVCFKSGTLVSAENGDVAIENIKVGDFVWATNEKTGETALKEVVQIFHNETEEWVHVTVNGEKITCTPEHPFYAPKKGWTSAVDLRAGDILVMLNGEYVVVEQVQHELLENPETTYNFEVEDYHTYYVGERPVLVHNKCGDVGSYSELKSSGAGKGNEVHHIVEKRFSDVLGVSKSQMPSVVLDHTTHSMYTQQWRQLLPYGKTYTAPQIYKAAKQIYANSPELLKWARFTIIGG